jgi:hypothetical protein
MADIQDSEACRASGRLSQQEMIILTKPRESRLPTTPGSDVCFESQETPRGQETQSWRLEVEDIVPKHPGLPPCRMLISLLNHSSESYCGKKAQEGDYSGRPCILSH